eukprot:jgi/Botrbrau1/2169/Bobra.101_2s0009.1
MRSVLAPGLCTPASMTQHMDQMYFMFYLHPCATVQTGIFSNKRINVDLGLALFHSLTQPASAWLLAPPLSQYGEPWLSSVPPHHLLP